MQSQHGINSENVKINNRALALRLLFANGSMSRSDIADALQLTRATVTTICNDFIAQGILRQMESSEQSAAAGRKKCPLVIRTDSYLVLSVSIDADCSYAALCDLRARALSSVCLPMRQNEKPEAFFARAAQACIKLVWEHGAKPSQVLGCGVVVIGPVDQINGVSLNSFEIWDRPVPVKELLEKELHMPVCVESNVCAALEAELLYDQLWAKNILAVKWGPGVGSASVINGSIYKGYAFRSSEVGHNRIAGCETKCRCGKSGCLETRLSLNAVYGYVATQLKASPSSPLSCFALAEGLPSEANLGVYLRFDDKAFRQYLAGLTLQLANVLSNAVALLAPERVLLYGSFFDAPFILESFKEQLLALNDSLSSDRLSYLPPEKCDRFTGAVAIAVRSLLVEAGGVPAIRA